MNDYLGRKNVLWDGDADFTARAHADASRNNAQLSTLLLSLSGLRKLQIVFHAPILATLRSSRNQGSTLKVLPIDPYVQDLDAQSIFGLTKLQKAVITGTSGSILSPHEAFADIRGGPEGDGDVSKLDAI